MAQNLFGTEVFEFQLRIWRVRFFLSFFLSFFKIIISNGLFFKAFYNEGDLQNGLHSDHPSTVVFVYNLWLDNAQKHPKRSGEFWKEWTYSVSSLLLIKLLDTGW